MRSTTPGPMKKRILHVARGMIRRNIHGFEIQKFGFDFGTRGDVKTQASKNLDDFASGLRNDMKRADVRLACGKRNVDAFVLEFRFEIRLLELGFRSSSAASILCFHSLAAAPIFGRSAGSA